MAARATLFSHQKRRALMAAPRTVHCLVKRRNIRIVAPFDKDCGTFCRENAAYLAKIVACLAESVAIPYPSASRTNPEANHKSAVRVFIKKLHTNLINIIVAFFLTRTVRTCVLHILPVFQIAQTIHTYQPSRVQ